MEFRSPRLQVDSLTAEPPRKPRKEGGTLLKFTPLSLYKPSRGWKAGVFRELWQRWGRIRRSSDSYAVIFPGKQKGSTGATHSFRCQLCFPCYSCKCLNGNITALGPRELHMINSHKLTLFCLTESFIVSFTCFANWTSFTKYGGEWIFSDLLLAKTLAFSAHWSRIKSTETEFGGNRKVALIVSW